MIAHELVFHVDGFYTIVGFLGRAFLGVVGDRGVYLCPMFEDFI